MHVSANVRAYLLLVLPLQVQPGLDVAPGLLEGLSLGDLSRVVGADPDHVGAQEDQHVGTDLSTEAEAADFVTQRPPPDMHVSHHKNTANSA